MKKLFQMHDFGSVSINLSMKIEHSQEGHTIEIQLDRYLGTLLAKIIIYQYRPVATSIVIKPQKMKPVDDTQDTTNFQSMIAVSAKCISVRKKHAILPDTPGILTSASKYFYMLPDPPGAKQSALRLCNSSLRCS